MRQEADRGGTEKRLRTQRVFSAGTYHCPSPFVDNHRRTRTPLGLSAQVRGRFSCSRKSGPRANQLQPGPARDQVRSTPPRAARTDGTTPPAEEAHEEAGHREAPQAPRSQRADCRLPSRHERLHAGRTLRHHTADGERHPQTPRCSDAMEPPVREADLMITHQVSGLCPSVRPLPILVHRHRQEVTLITVNEEGDMATTLNRVVEDIAPLASEEQREATRAAISQILSDTAQVALRLPGGEEYRLDGDELRALRAIALARANGQRVSVISHDVILSPQQAAELLGVSRPMVYRFIERGDLTATRVGTHWRLLTADVLALAERRTRLADGVDTGLDHVAQAMTSSRQGTAAKDGAKESWRAATPEQKEASLERVRRRTRGRRQ